MVEKEKQTIWGGPTKRFFVSMLTRDIELRDAILDLIDNSVDGATRQLKGKVKKADAYGGFETRITLSSKSFDISDNCGGIPQDAVQDAFMLGRPKVEKDKGIPTIGVYGIGMKRAIFKIGEEISTVGGSLRDVQMLAGHTNLRTTQRYIEANAEAQIRIVDLV